MTNKQGKLTDGITSLYDVAQSAGSVECHAIGGV